MELEADVMGHAQFLWMRLFLTSLRQGDGRNIIGTPAIINVPGQRGGNITMCAAISQNGLFTIMQPWAHITLTHYYIPGHLHDMLTNVQRPEQTRYVIIWDNVSFIGCFGPKLVYRSPTLHCTQLPPYSPS